MGALRRLEYRVAIVTGGGRGIGKAIALAYAGEGASVAVVARSPEGIRQVAAEIVAQGGSALAVQAEVSLASDVARMVAETLACFGKADILFNAAGQRAVVPSAELPVADWQRVLDGSTLLAPVRLHRWPGPASRAVRTRPADGGGDGRQMVYGRQEGWKELKVGTESSITVQ